MTDPIAAINIASTGIEVIKRVKKIGAVRAFIVKFLPKHSVLMLGSSGTGKTNLKDSLAEVIPHAIDRLDRTTRSKEHLFNVEGRYFKFIDVPGQRMSESERSQTIRENLKKVEGIIHVVCYGYHEGTSRGVSEAVIDENTPNKEYLKKNRKDEISNIIEISKFFGPGSKASWIITVVSKADLWWDELDKVMKYYHDGEYGKILEANLSLKRGCVAYCSVIHKYYDKLKLSGNFDDEERIKLKNQFISNLLDMASAKKKENRK